MGKISMPPKPIRYPYPKAIGKKGYSRGIVLGRAMLIERFNNWGDYMRIVDWVRFDDGHRELRFTQYYRKAKGTDQDWVYGQGAGHMSASTFYKLIKKAKTNPDCGSFKGVFARIHF